MHTQYNSVREYILVYAQSLPTQQGYFCARKSAEHVVCPIYKETIDELFADLIIYADNEIFALVKALDILIYEEVFGVSYQQLATVAHSLILNPSGHNNRTPIEDRTPFDVEAEIMNDVVFNIHTFWLKTKPMAIVFI